MTDKIRDILNTALQAGRNGTRWPADIAEAIADNDRDVALDRLGFDSLGWMEFCISVELQSGLELTPNDIDTMRDLAQIDAWLRARL